MGIAYKLQIHRGIQKARISTVRECRSLPSASCIYNRQFRRRPDLSPRIDVREKRDPDFLQEDVETPLQNTYLRDDASLTTS